MCHYDFTGGGSPWNPYGDAVRAVYDKKAGEVAAFQAVESLDSDGDGSSNIEEITNSLIDPGEPTFPGLNASNAVLVVNVDPSAIINYVTPTTEGPDLTDPVVEVLGPNGGETVTGNVQTVVSWIATDNVGIGSTLEMINQVYVDLPQGDEPVAVGFMTGVIATLPAAGN
jgi:hypothetical protein